jgi:hypothetical protein
MPSTSRIIVDRDFLAPNQPSAPANAQPDTRWTFESSQGAYRS